MSETYRSRWIWISSLVFGITAGLLKLAFFPYPEYNPPAIYPAFTAFLFTTLLWRWLVEKCEQVSVFRGGMLGIIVGLFTPVLMWPVFLFILALHENRFPEILLWSPIYMLMSLRNISWLTALIGTILGVILVYFRRRANVRAESAS